MSSALNGYLELIKQAQSLDELREVGKDISYYLQTVPVHLKMARREILAREYKLNKVEIPPTGARIIEEEPEPVEMQLERGTVDFSRIGDGRVEIMVSDIAARSRRIPCYMIGHIMHQTERAILFRTDMPDVHYEGWIPRSQVRILREVSEPRRAGREYHDESEEGHTGDSFDACLTWDDFEAHRVSPNAIAIRPMTHDHTGGVVTGREEWPNDHLLDASRYLGMSVDWERDRPPTYAHHRTRFRATGTASLRDMSRKVGSSSIIDDMMRAANALPNSGGLRYGRSIITNAMAACANLEANNRLQEAVHNLQVVVAGDVGPLIERLAEAARTTGQSMESVVNSFRSAVIRGSTTIEDLERSMNQRLDHNRYQAMVNGVWEPTVPLRLDEEE